VHGAWLLNRFHNHSTTKTSAFELVHGRRYAGKIASFGIDEEPTPKLVLSGYLECG